MCFLINANYDSSNLFPLMHDVVRFCLWGIKGLFYVLIRRNWFIGYARKLFLCRYGKCLLQFFLECRKFVFLTCSKNTFMFKVPPTVS